MPQSPRRRLHAIDAELRAHRDVTLAAVAELAEVRRRQAELHDMEAALVMTIDVRRRRMDGLLDQRLDTVVSGGGPSPAECGTVASAWGR